MLVRSNIWMEGRPYQPVIQAANADPLSGARIAAQKYGPPLVGIADTISAIPKATNIVKKHTTIHPMDITPGPPVDRPYSKSVVIPVTTLMIEKETPKLCSNDQLRLSSCSYPSCASRSSSPIRILVALWFASAGTMFLSDDVLIVHDCSLFSILFRLLKDRKDKRKDKHEKNTQKMIAPQKKRGYPCSYRRIPP